jgi:hypothetical protein
LVIVLIAHFHVHLAVVMIVLAVFKDFGLVDVHAAAAQATA